jgi:hypothetical protein
MLILNRHIALIGMSQDITRFSTIDMSLPNDAMLPLWQTYYAVGSVAGSLSLLVVLLIVFTPSLRKNAFHKFIAALSLPDATYSLLCAMDCARNAVKGQWERREVNCQFQVRSHSPPCLRSICLFVSLHFQAFYITLSFIIFDQAAYIIKRFRRGLKCGFQPDFRRCYDSEIKSLK